ncbi:MAG: AAA family ATPase [Defluviicoccus sp.]|nr:AAA family ATPase [Defluviicoccus sp.]
MTFPQQPEQIASLRVTRLFGRFDHTLLFPAESDISIITAPNGYGKTVLLQMIDSLFNKQFSFFWKIDFEKVEIFLTSGKSIGILKDTADLFNEHRTDPPGAFRLTTAGFGADGQLFSFSDELLSRQLRSLERNLPIDQVGPDRWHDFTLDRSLSTYEIVDRYADQLPKSVLGSVALPEWLQRALDSVDAHLVETQRLLYLEEPEERRPRGRRDRTTPPPVVERDANDLAQHIGRLLQQYANESQKLDQTFPKRILAFHSDSVSEETEIRANLEELTQKQDDLMSVGLLRSTASEPIQPSDIFQQESIRRILSIYVDDTRQKLSIFDNTYAKIRLFKQLLDEHFSFKTVVIDPDKGISAIDNDSGEGIPLSGLSSGEQHELVLIYELLFKVREGAVILVDEPELSLHVSWQKRFISDLKKIQELRKIKVVIATHSPQIINNEWDLVQDLTA